MKKPLNKKVTQTTSNKAKVIKEKKILMSLGKNYSTQQKYRMHHPKHGTITVQASRYEKKRKEGYSHDLPNFSPHTHDHICDLFSPNKTLEIKDKYKFFDNFNLSEELNELDGWFKIYEDLHGQTPRSSESKNIINELINALQALSASALYVDNIINKLGITNNLLLVGSSAAQKQKAILEQNYNDYFKIFLRKSFFYPTELERNAYIFINSDHPRLFYVDQDMSVSVLELIVNQQELRQILSGVKKINFASPLNGQVSNDILSSLWGLIRINPGHNHIVNPVATIQGKLEKFNREIQYDLKHLEAVCFDAVKEIPDDKTGRRANTSDEQFMQHLANLYKEGTGKKLKVYTSSKSTTGGIYKGDFFTFAKEIFTVLNLSNTESSIGQLAIKVKKQV